ncbi:MAG: hypothetical protein WC900_05835 [Oscillospiraceae bacterium]|jgi:hypothetical protein
MKSPSFFEKRFTEPSSHAELPVCGRARGLCLAKPGKSGAFVLGGRALKFSF